MTETTTSSRGVVESYLEAAAAGDVQTLRDAFAEDATWWLHGDLPIAGTWKGRDAILDEFLATALSFYEPGSIEIEPTSLIADGDRVVAEWTSRARTRTGKPYENFCIAVFTVRDGKIQAVREYMDTLYAQRTAFGG